MHLTSSLMLLELSSMPHRGLGLGSRPPPRKFQPPTKSIPLNRSIKKIGRIDYTREGASYTKFGRNPFTGGFWANGWNITKIIFIYLYLFSLISLQVRPLDGLFTRDSSKNALVARWWKKVCECYWYWCNTRRLGLRGGRTQTPRDSISHAVEI